MAFEEKRCCLWHAFNALDDDNSGLVNKSKLKVLTQNISITVGVQNAEVNLDTFRETKNISFQDYLEYLKLELFNHLTEQSKDKNANVDLSKVDSVCWWLWSKKFLQREKPLLSDEDLFRLWRLFNFLSEADDNGDPYYPVVLDIEELALSIEKLLSIVGEQYVEEVFYKATDGRQQFDFLSVLEILELHFLDKLTPDVIAAAIKEIYDDYVNGVMKKDMLGKKAPGRVPGGKWAERWFVLTPDCLRYYATRDEADVKGEVAIRPSCIVQPVPDKHGMHSRPNRFNLVTEGRTYELNAPDVRTKTIWMKALQTAVDQSNKPYSPQKVALLKRRSARRHRAEQRRAEEEKRRREAEKNEKTNQELIAEKQARAKLQLEMIEEKARWQEEIRRLEAIDEERAALKKRLAEQTTEREGDRQKLDQLEEERAYLQQKLLEEASIREAEKRRLREMQEMKRELERLLEEERQAKRDEELVRAAQARMLEEEFLRREELELRQKEMEVLLVDERQRREGLEADRKKQEQLIEQARQQLEQQTLSRKSMDRRMQDALDKLSETERAKRDMEVQLAARAAHKVTIPDVFTNPEFHPLVSHRGVGAFTEGYFDALQRSRSHDVPLTSDGDADDCVVDDNLDHPSAGDVVDGVFVSSEQHSDLDLDQQKQHPGPPDNLARQSVGRQDDSDCLGGDNQQDDNPNGADQSLHSTDTDTIAQSLETVELESRDAAAESLGPSKGMMGENSVRKIGEEEEEEAGSDEGYDRSADLLGEEMVAIGDVDDDKEKVIEVAPR